MEWDAERHARFVEDQIEVPTFTNVEERLKSVNEGPRGFVVERCSECPMREEILGGYDRDEVRGYTCQLYERRIEEVTGAFPSWCRLKPVSKVWRDTIGMVNAVREIVEELNVVVGYGRK